MCKEYTACVRVHIYMCCLRFLIHAACMYITLDEEEKEIPTPFPQPMARHPMDVQIELQQGKQLSTAFQKFITTGTAGAIFWHSNATSTK